MCASDKRRRPMEGSISQDLHESAVACAHRLGDICVDNGRQHQPIFTCILRGPYDLGKRRRPTAGVIGQVTLVVVCPLCRGLCKLLSQRRPWTACIGRGMRNIGRGLVDNMRMSMHSQNQKSEIMHYNIFIYFPSSILNVSASRGSFVPIFIIFTVYYFLRNILKIKIY